MRTSPEHVRRRPTSRALPLALVALLALAGAACGDDGPEQSTPTTTAPATTEAATTTEGSDGPAPTTDAGAATSDGAPGSSTPGSSGPGGEGTSPALSDDDAAQVITQLMASYRAALDDAKARNAGEEDLLVALSNVYLGAATRSQVDGLASAGGLAIVRPDPQPPEVGAVEVVGGDDACVTGSVRVLLDPMFTRSLGAVQPHSFRLEPARDGAPAPAWRLSYLSYSSDGSYTEEAACP